MGWDAAAAAAAAAAGLVLTGILVVALLHRHWYGDHRDWKWRRRKKKSS